MQRFFLTMTRAETVTELARIRKFNAKAKREGRFLDVAEAYELALDEAVRGIERCGACGNVITRDASTTEQFDIWWDENNAKALFAELSTSQCPRPVNTAPDYLTVAECMKRGECACTAGDAIRKAQGTTP